MKSIHNNWLGLSGVISASLISFVLLGCSGTSNACRNTPVSQISEFPDSQGIWFTSEGAADTLDSSPDWLFTIEEKSSDNRWVIVTLTSSENAEDGGRVEQIRKLYNVPCKKSYLESDMDYSFSSFDTKEGKVYLKTMKNGNEAEIDLKKFPQ